MAERASACNENDSSSVEKKKTPNTNQSTAELIVDLLPTNNSQDGVNKNAAFNQSIHIQIGPFKKTRST